MRITERQEQILNTIVGEYINSAQPVSSRLLEKKYDFGISPATIRIEMQELIERGYLCQPHTSAGRIPTDKGYRFFVDDLLKEETINSKNIFEIERLLQKEKKEILGFVAHLTKFLARTSSNLVTVCLLKKNFFWEEGWGEVLQEPEFKEKNLISDFTKLLENFEEDIGFLKINSGIKIYIGRENPFPKAKAFSIMSFKCYLPDDQESIISLLGPKRMAYQRNISLMNSLIELLEKF